MFFLGARLLIVLTGHSLSNSLVMTSWSCVEKASTVVAGLEYRGLADRRLEFWNVQFFQITEKTFDERGLRHGKVEQYGEEFVIRDSIVVDRMTRTGNDGGI